jgi:hypothetical protein
MNLQPRIILALCLIAAFGTKFAAAVEKPPPKGVSAAPPPVSAPVVAPVVAPPGVITGPVQTPVSGGPPPIQAAGPPPTGLAVSGTPLVANLSWSGAPGSVRNAVYRSDGVNPSLEVTPAGFTGIQFQDIVPDPRITYRYVVVAYYPNGTSAASAQVQFLSPPPINPSGFSVRDQGQGSVLFEWQAVAGTATYRLDGTGLPNTGYVVTIRNTTRFVRNPSAVVANMPAGAGSWRLVALYPGNYADFPSGPTAAAVIHVLPPHPTSWLTKNNGIGQDSQVETPAHQVINDSFGGSATGNPSGDLLQAYDPTYALWLGSPFYTNNGGAVYRPDATLGVRNCVVFENPLSGCARPGLKVWLDTTSPMWDDPEQAANEAIYGNPGDIGVGRRTYCEQKFRGPPVPGIYTVCYATAHGPKPGEAGFDDFQTIAHPTAGVGADFILSMVIIKDASGTVFLALGKPTGNRYNLLTTVGLDTEGSKRVPFVCLSCHGGNYNSNTRKVDGASFLPLDPELLAFASPADQASQEEKIRKINLMIYNSGSSPVITSFVNGLYNGAIAQPGATATPDFVPSGWAPQAGLYRQIVRPYCIMCHMAVAGTDPDLNFFSWTNFKQNDVRIQGAVCGAHTMPHSELQYKAFWLKDTGSLYLPGLLFASLSVAGC